LPLFWSIGIALGAGFGTQIWSTASRALWSHTWQITLLGWVVYLLLTSAERNKFRPILTATLLSWMFFVRPTSAVSILCVTAFVLISHPRAFVTFASTGVLWLMAFFAYSLAVFGKLIPSYYSAPGVTPNIGRIPVALTGDLFSPARGLLVFVPIVALILYLVIRFWRTLSVERRALARLALVAITIHAIVIAAQQPWWGGSCYGPRLFTDVIPWFVLLAILGVAGLLDQRGQVDTILRRRVGAIGTVLVIMSVMMNAPGALSWSTMEWNLKPISVTASPPVCGTGAIRSSWRGCRPATSR